MHDMPEGAQKLCLLPTFYYFEETLGVPSTRDGEQLSKEVSISRDNPS